MQERTYCPQCQTFRFKPVGERCFHCAQVPTETGAASAVTPAPSPVTVTSEAVTFANVTVDAPGFTQDQFERAICRAIADDLVVSIDATGQHIVGPAGVNGGYRTTRTICDCKAGSCGTPCKHRARLIAYLDIREPALRRQWASVRKLVAA